MKARRLNSGAPRLRLTARTALVFAIAALASTAFPALASASHTVTRTSGSVTATLSWKHNFERTKDFRLAIARGGTQVYDAEVKPEICKPRKAFPCVWPAGEEPLDLTDLDGDGEPEAVVGAFTGGAHCCVIAVVYRWTGSGYAAAENNFFDPGYDLADLDGDGSDEFVSADSRFAYLYGSFAESVFPLMIVGFDQGDFSDVTAQFPGKVEDDADALRHEYKRRASSNRKIGVRTSLAAYLADLYTLGRADDAKRILHRALNRGLLERHANFEIGPFGHKYVHDVKRKLKKFGYA